MNENKCIEELIIQDHNEIKGLYEKYKSNCSNKEEGTKYFNQICWEIARHEVAEEIIFYSAIRERVTDGKLLSEEALKDQTQIKTDLCTLNSMDRVAKEFDLKFKEVFSNFLKHCEKEESIYIPGFIKQYSSEERIAMGKKFQNRKLIAPTHPHPSDLQNYPFLQTIQGVLMAPVDKFIDLFKKFPDTKSVEGVKESSGKGIFTN